MMVRRRSVGGGNTPTHLRGETRHHSEENLRACEAHGVDPFYSRTRASAGQVLDGELTAAPLSVSVLIARAGSWERLPAS